MKDVRYNNYYRVKWANFKWINLNSDSTLVAMELTTVNSCSVTEYPASGYGVGVIQYDTNANSGNDGYPGVTIKLKITYYSTGTAYIDTITSNGAARQEHPIYYDMAPCNDCSTVDEGDDVFTVRTNYAGAGAEAEQHYETNWDEDIRATPDYSIYDQKCDFWGSCSFYRQWRWSSDVYLNGYTSYWSVAYALKCSACTDTTFSQYTNGPWDYENQELFWVEHVQFAMVKYRNAGSGGWTSSTRVLSD